MQPLQATVLHPKGCTLDGAGVIIERGPYADHNRTNSSAVCRHPFLLLRTAKSDKHNTGAGPVEAIDNFLVFSLA